MTRRARMGPIQAVDRGLARMAPGGRRSASESPIRPFHRPVRAAGKVVAPSTPSVVLRPATITEYTPPMNLVGGGGNNTLRDQSDATYARMEAYVEDGVTYSQFGSVVAHLDTPALGWEPARVTVTVRGRSLVTLGGGARIRWSLMKPDGSKFFGTMGSFTPLTRWDLGSDWVDKMSDTWAPGGVLKVPTSGEVAAGLVVRLECFGAVPPPAAGTIQVDCSEVSVLLEGMEA